MCGVPTDARRKQERGFDLPEELLQPVAQLQGLPWQQLLARVRPTHHLYDLPPQERQKALLGCFAVQADVRGKSIMLADDIFTTGATMQACARVLRQAGAARVAGLAFSSSPVNFADAGAEEAQVCAGDVHHRDGEDGNRAAGGVTAAQTGATL